MRTEVQDRQVESHGELSSAHFGISTNDQAHIIGILRDRLYSDKILAVLREYTANAWDAHKENNCDRRVKVVLPSKFNPVLRIRDFGPGISEEDIYDVYCKYGNSTKRNSNTAVGMLGIGCKSGFAYSDVFTVVSYNGGLKKTYSAFIDNTNLGQMSKLGEEPTDETGIEIQIPVKVSDVIHFRIKAITLFQYMDPRPDVNAPVPERRYTIVGTGWKVREKWEGGPVAIMGTIGYPIKTNRLHKVPDHLKTLLNAAIDFTFPIGAVDISASREDLEYTDKTMSAIQTALELCQRELQANLRKQLAGAKNVWEARKIFQTATAGGEYSYQNNQRVQNIMYTIAYSMKTWHGFDLSQTRFETARATADMEVRMITARGDKSLGVSTNSYRTTINYDDHPVIGLADVKSGWVGRALQMREDLIADGEPRGPVIIVRFLTDDVNVAQAAFKKYLKDKALEGIPTYKLSDYDLPATGRGSGGGPSVRNKKTYKKVFKLNASTFDQNASAPSTNWEPEKADLETGKGVYMCIHTFRQFEGGKMTSLAATARQLANLKAVGVDLSTLSVIGVKPKELSKVGDGWEKFTDWYTKKIKAFVDSNQNLHELLELQAIQQNVNMNQRFVYKNRAKSLITAGMDPQHPVVMHFMDVFQKLEKANSWTKTQIAQAEIVYTAIRNLPAADRPEVSYNVEEKSQALGRSYPMLRPASFFDMPYLGYYYHNNAQAQKTEGRFSPAQAEMYTTYVNLVDSQKEEA